MNVNGLREVLAPYEGPNQAHRRYRSEFKCLNALYYLIVSSKATLQERLQKSMDDAKRGSLKRRNGGEYALGVVTQGISNTQFRSVVVPRVDAEELVSNFGRFIDVFTRQCIISVHRIYLNYLTDALIELDSLQKLHLDQPTRDKLLDRWLRPDKVTKVFIEAGIPVCRCTDDTNRVLTLAATRNALEHNDGKATPEYLEATGCTTLRIGDLIPATSVEIGAALSCVNHVVTDLNQRLVVKFGL